MTPDAQGQPKRRIRFWLALAAAAFLIALLVLPPLISVARYKIRITQLVSTALRRPVRLSSVELRILPRPGFVLSDLTVAEDPAYGAEPVLHANTVTTAIRLSSLWRGRLQLSRISVDEASLNLVRTPEGRWNLDSFFRTAATLPGPVSGKPTAFPYLEATNSRINIKNGVEKLPYSLLNADASLWQESGVWRIRLRGQPARTDVSLDLADTGIVRLEATIHPAARLDQMPLHIDLDWREAQLGQLSRLLLGSDEGWRGNLTGEVHFDGTSASAKVTSRLRASGVHRAEFAPASPLDFDASCAFDYRSANRAMQNLLCESPIGGGRARLTGNLPGYPTPPSLSLELDRVPVQAGLDVLRTFRTNVAPGLQAAGAVSGKMSYQPPSEPIPALTAGGFSPRHGTIQSRVGSRKSTQLQPVPSPLTGAFTLQGLSLSGDALSTPIQVARVVLEPAPFISGQPPALVTSVTIPAGGPSPLAITARLSHWGFLVGVRGTATLPRLRQLIHVAGIPQAESLDQLAGEPAILDVTAEGPWLPAIYPLMASNPAISAPIPVAPFAPDQSSGTLSGTITFHDANWKSAFLTNPVMLRAATLHFENGALLWDPLEFFYGPVRGTATLALPPSCEGPAPCSPHFAVQFDSLDASALQSAILGAQTSGTLLSTLLARLQPNTPRVWPLLDGTLQAGTLDLGPFSLTGVSATVRVLPTGADITALDATLYGGEIHATASLVTGDKPSYKAEVSFQKLKPAGFSDLLGMNCSGASIDGSTQFQLSGYSDKDLAASAKGTLQFDWTHGSVASLVGKPVPTPLARFDRLTGSGNIADGALMIDQIQIQRGNKKSTVAATVTFGIPAPVTFPAPPDQHPAHR